MKKIYMVLSLTILHMALKTYASDISTSFLDFDHNCTKPGLLCKNCSLLVDCIKIDNEFMEIEIENCNTDAGETCLVDHCSPDPNAQCGDTSEFACPSTGVFPDPLDCHLFHVCVEARHNLETNVSDSDYEHSDLFFSVPANYDETRETLPNGMVHIPAKCDDDYGYNSITTYCSVKLNDNICPSKPPVPTCRNLGQNGPIPGTSMFYVCVKGRQDKLIAKLYMCPHGTKYVNGTCS